MTGRELIIYISENHLENKHIIDDEVFFGSFMTEGEAAEKFGVGLATLNVWIEYGLVPTIKLRDKLYIPKYAENPKSLVGEEKNHV